MERVRVDEQSEKYTRCEVCVVSVVGGGPCFRLETVVCRGRLRNESL